MFWVGHKVRGIEEGIGALRGEVDGGGNVGVGGGSSGIVRRHVSVVWVGWWWGFFRAVLLSFYTH